MSYTANSFVDGKRASYLLVYQAPGSNAMTTAEGVYKAMDDMKKYFPADIDYKVPFESVSVVKVSIQDVVRTLLIALLLVTIVVFLFLQNWRSTLIPVLAIPVSIIGTFIFFIPLGFTINTLTMFGFVLAIGIVVDDAIVVVEAVQHYIDEEGLSPKEATSRALEGYYRACNCDRVNSCVSFCARRFYSGNCWKIVSAVCDHHCYFCFDLRIRCAFINSCFVFIVIKTTAYQ